MRLLNARTLKLHSFQEEEAPEYAILSHTWHDDEVLFEDLRDMAQASKQAGFTKIRFCCDQALKDEIQFIWVDTCCIDKASSAELSEAINSMFRWYRNAKVCYAYLQDVLNREHGDRKMRQSRWFKRAWTLQELLAPSRLVFYSNNWTTLGTKDDVKVIVSRATGIDEEYLTERPLEMASIAKRMSWASKREATRAEDIAYSLFGVFDVQMPLLYGEGLRKAFMRLQEEIMKSSNDHTLFAWTRPSGPNSYSETSSVLAPSPDCFADSSNLVPTEKINPLSPYTMTNMGLRIFLPLSHDFSNRKKVKEIKDLIFSRPPPETPDGVTAALNCHIEYDYFHVVTLPLLHLGSNQFVRLPGRILEKFPVRSLSNYTMQEIFIKNEVTGIFPTSRRHLGFIFRKLPPVAAVRGVYPEGLWISKERIIQGQLYARENCSWHACVHLELARENPRKDFFLLVGVDFHKTPQGKSSSHAAPWDEKNIQASTWCAAFPSMNENLAAIYARARSKDFKKNHGFCEFDGVGVSLNEASPETRDRDCTPFIDVMGEYMCVVDIGYH